MMRAEDFIFYADSEQADFEVVCDWEMCFSDDFYDDDEEAEIVRSSSRIASRLVSFASEFGLSGDVWKQWIAYLLILDENPFSLACERRQIDIDSTMVSLAILDFANIYELFHGGPQYQAEDHNSALVDFTELFSNYKAPYSDDADNPAGALIRDLAGRLAKAKGPTDFADAVIKYYEQYGAGMYGLYKSFRVECDDAIMEIKPVKNAEDVSFDRLIGCDNQIRTLKENTEAFLAGLPANNVLLYGDSGTGKSTSVHALLHDYYDQGLRLVEIDKAGRTKLPVVLAEIKKRNYKFILFLDDLSFEEDESDYKELKAMLEGALESKNDNILIYATSNRRHLIRETWGDRADMEFNEDVHRSDTMEEKLSLASRFGISIYFSKPDQDGYFDIVRGLAARSGLAVDDEELKAEARKWELRHGGRTGRAAEQLVRWLMHDKNLD